MSWQKACMVAEIETGSARAVNIGEERVLLCRLPNEEIHAVEDRCSHDGAGLADGALHGAEIECPRHGARFDITTGAALRMPAVAPIETYPIRISDDGWVEIDLEEAE